MDIYGTVRGTVYGLVYVAGAAPPTPGPVIEAVMVVRRSIERGMDVVRSREGAMVVQRVAESEWKAGQSS